MSRKLMLLVGAPLANSSGSPGINQPGAFYKCLIDKPVKGCQEIYLDRSRNFVSNGQGKIPFRKNAWTGAAFDIDNDGNVLVCGGECILRERISRKWSLLFIRTRSEDNQPYL
ncbi:hypothetical protein Avbf_19025 [Armadillidium vulgare]|nr:hypothetical protein Avbf_19025 [Armadillidium vulgare]